MRVCIGQVSSWLLNASDRERGIPCGNIGGMAFGIVDDGRVGEVELPAYRIRWSMIGVLVLTTPWEVYEIGWHSGGRLLGFRSCVPFAKQLWAFGSLRVSVDDVTRLIDRVTRDCNRPGGRSLERGVEDMVIRAETRVVEEDCRGRGCMSGLLAREFGIALADMISKSFRLPRRLRSVPVSGVGEAGRGIPEPVELAGGLPFSEIDATNCHAGERLPCVGRAATEFHKDIPNLYKTVTCSCVGRCVCLFPPTGSGPVDVNTVVVRSDFRRPGRVTSVGNRLAFRGGVCSSGR